MNSQQSYTAIYTASPYFKNADMKIFVTLQLCHISYNVSKGALYRSKYSSGVFSINSPHSDSLDFVLPANLSCGLFMGLIEQMIFSK